MSIQQSIPASLFVNVTPGVLSAGGAALDLNGLILTQSTRVPIGTVVSFPTAAAVGAFFGLSSVEYTDALIYFAGYNNSFSKPGALLFAQYPGAAVSAYLQGGNISALTLSQLQAISGGLTIVFDGYSRADASFNLSAATSFSSAAGIIQTAINSALPTEATSTASSIAANTFTVGGTLTGSFGVGQTLVGAGVTAGTIITSLGTGTGGAGTYTVNNSQTVGSESISTTATPVVVSYDSVSGAFVVTSGVTGVASTSAFATGTMAATLLLTQATGAVLSQGAAAATPGPFMSSITNITQNWALFMLAFNPDVSGNANKFLFAEWVATQNNRYCYVCGDTDISPTTTVPATSSMGYLVNQAGISGVCLVWETSGEHIAPFVLGWAASLNFSQTNGRADLEFRSQSGLVPSVVSATAYQNLLANGYNGYCSVATANQQFIYFANGSVSGEFLWMDSYVNQIWLNNGFQLALMNLLTSGVGSIPYNSAGYALIEAALADPINAALNFGAIRTGVTLSAAQIAEINFEAGSNVAQTLSTRGWYLKVGDASASVRAARGSPPCTFWYTDGEDIQQINLSSINVQ